VEGGARMIPVAEIATTGLNEYPTESEASGARDRFAQERMAEGAVFHVFADGLRVGRFTAAAGFAVDSSTCGGRPGVDGVLELIPQAAQVQEFLALPDTVGQPRPRGTYAPLSATGGTRFESRRIFGEEIPRLGARYPSSMDRARGELKLFTLRGSSAPAISSTYLFRDRLSTGEPTGSGAYSMMMVAERGPDGYESRFTWYRRADVDGKGNPSVVDHLDWDDDGDAEMLLRVHGADASWFAALDRNGDSGWEMTFEDSCRPPAPPPAG